MSVLYAIAIAAAACAIIASLVPFFLDGSRLISFGNWALASGSFVAFFIASMIVTVVQNKAVDIFNKYGEAIGVYAYGGVKYHTLTWVAAAMMFLASGPWFVEFCVGEQ
jgi:hypothetical protein